MRRLKPCRAACDWRLLIALNDAAVSLFKLLDHHRPADAKTRKAAIKAAAAAKAEGKKVELTKEESVIFGVSAVTTAIEAKKAQLVVIAADVDPIEARDLPWLRG